MDPGMTLQLRKRALVDVFISYKQDEREAVQIIASALSDLKLAVWFDASLRSGDSFDEKIAEALGSAAAVLVCWTPAAVRSDWVRAEATDGRESDRLAACFLHPTALIPPFNLTHAEDLSTWAGQEDDPAWIKLLERIGELVGRPGISTYHEVLRPDASLEELTEWANANGADPLAATIWARIEQLEGEGASERIERQKAEARAAGERRKALRAKSRRLARERGLRDPVTQKRRRIALVVSVAAVAVALLGKVVYDWDAQKRERDLRDNRTSVAEVRAFVQENAWHPIADVARDRLAQLDLEAWTAAQAAGTVEAFDSYLADAEGEPVGAFVRPARTARSRADTVRSVQEMLRRLQLYSGPADGAYGQESRDAVRLFQARWNLPVSDEIDGVFLDRLNVALSVWIRPRPGDLRAQVPGPPRDEDVVGLAADLNVDIGTVLAISAIQIGPEGGFDGSGRPRMAFRPDTFSVRTGGRYDAVYPRVSGATAPTPSNPDRHWSLLEEAFALDEAAALESTNWGSLDTTWGSMFMLGGNFRRFGFESVGEFVRFLSHSEANQFQLLARFAVANGLTGAMQRQDWDGLARAFGGDRYRPGTFDARMRRAHSCVIESIARGYGSLGPEAVSAAERPPPRVGERPTLWSIVRQCRPE